MISRRHCAIVIHQSKVILQDFGSKNGTYINGERVEGDQELEKGDRVKVGPLQFEMLIDRGLGGAKKAPVKNVTDAANRTASKGAAKSSGDIDGWDVSGWLEEEDEAERMKRMADPDTRQYKLDEAEQLKLKNAGEEGEKDEAKKKKEPGKLPVRPEESSKDSQTAAEKMLKKFFHNPDADAK